MKIACNRERLLSAFQTAATVVPGRSPKPVLQTIKMEASEEGLTLSATDMEVGIRIEVPDETAEVPGRALLSVSQFGSILRESNDEVLHIEADGNSVVVKGDRSRFKLPSGNPAEFPDVPQFTESNYHVVNARLLKELIRRTLFATDNESSRYALGGILLEVEGEKLTAVATDGRRLARMSGPITQEGEPPQTDAMTIVPSRSMQLIERTLVDPEADVHLVSRGNDFLVRCPSATIITRLVEGRFPRWRDVIPDRPDAVVIDLTVGPFYSALRQAAIAASTETRGVDLFFGNGTLVMRGVAAEIGESQVEIPIGYDGQEIAMRLDHRYVADFLKVLDSERAFTLSIVDGDNAAFFETDDSYGYVVMPLARETKSVATAAAAGTE